MIIKPIEVTTIFAFNELLKISQQKGESAKLIVIDRSFRLVENGIVKMQVKEKHPKDKESSIFFWFGYFSTDYASCKAVKIDDALNLMKDYPGISEWFLFNLSRFA